VGPAGQQAYEITISAELKDNGQAYFAIKFILGPSMQQLLVETTTNHQIWSSCS
jgi:hypothetical protein